jgi:hypothetical protein
MRRRLILIKEFGNRSPKRISGVATGQKARFSGSGRTCEAAPRTPRVAAGRVRSWWCVGSLGRRYGFLVAGSAFVVADRGCATTGLPRGGIG